MNKLIVLLEGSMICNEGTREEVVLDMDDWGEYTIAQINDYVSKLKYGYYITGYRHVYTVYGKIIIVDRDENYDFIKETEI